MMLDLGGGFVLRRAEEGDHAALCRVCLETGDAGADASRREDDPALIGLIYAVPYQVLEPDFAFVVDGPQGVAGYLLGTPNTAAFNARLAQDWYPRLQADVTRPPQDPALWRGSDWARHAILHPRLAVPEALRPFPAHGHIDLLPPARGRGIGRRCMGFLEERLRRAGTPGLFLDVHPDNARAQAFYRSLGYRTLDRDAADASLFMVKRLEP